MARVDNRIRTLQFWYPNIPRKLVMANGLSIQAKFVYMYMSCQSENFDFFLEPMANELGIGTRTLSKYIAELIDSGWVTKGGQKFKNGRLGAVDYTINTSPKKPKKENTDVQKSACSNSDVSNCAPKYNSNTSIPIKQDSSINTPISNENEEVDNKLSPIINEGSTRFVKPTIEQISAYIKEKGYHIEAEYFYNYYESVNWMRGKTKMKNWKSTLATWEHKSNQEKEEKEEKQAVDDAEMEQWGKIKNWLHFNVPRIASRISYDDFKEMKGKANGKSEIVAEIIKEIDQSYFNGNIVSRFYVLAESKEYRSRIEA